MPILVTCPKCAAKSNAPDSAAGKAVRCPKAGCGTVVPVAALVPAEEEPVEGKVVARPPRGSPPHRSRKPTNAPGNRRGVMTTMTNRRGSDPAAMTTTMTTTDRGGVPGETTRTNGPADAVATTMTTTEPRRKRSGTGRRGGGGGGGGGRTAAIVVAVLVGLAVLGGIGYGIYRLAGGGSGPKSPPPPGWKQYVYESDGFSAYFPKSPDVSGAGRAGGNPFGGLGGVAPDPTGSTLYSCGLFDTEAEHRVAVVVIRLASDTSAADRERMMAEFRKQQKVGSSRSVKWLGQTAEEFTSAEGTARVAFVGNRGYVAVIGAGRGGRVKSDVENGFFDSIELLK